MFFKNIVCFLVFILMAFPLCAQTHPRFLDLDGHEEKPFMQKIYKLRSLSLKDTQRSSYFLGIGGSDYNPIYLY